MKKYILVASFICVLFAGSSSVASAQYTGPEIDLEGWAWSSNIGWISLNCSNPTQERDTNDNVIQNFPNGTCAGTVPSGHDYAVTIETSGNLTGYAWSPNIGWIDFGGLSGFPLDDSRVAHDGNARAVGTYPNLQLEGWARALSHGGGWDGWISLSGTDDNGSSYGVSMNSSGATVGSYAWGGAVVGWISFRLQATDPGDSLTFGPPPPPTVSLTVNHTETHVGAPIVLTHTVGGYPDSCTASNTQTPTDPGWDGSVAATAGTHSTTITPSVRGNITYTVTCTNAGGSDTDSVTVTSKANIEITGFSAAAPTPPDANFLSSVTFSLFVDGINDSQFTSVPYRLELGTRDDVGNVSQGANSLTLSGLSYLDSGPVLLRVDYPFDGIVDEEVNSTPIDDDVVDNTRNTVTVDIPKPEPRMTITTSADTVRKGESFTVSWTAEAPYSLTCDIEGPGLNTTDTDGTTPIASLSGSATVVDGIQNKAVYNITCTDLNDVGDPEASETAEVEVTVSVEEV